MEAYPGSGGSPRVLPEQKVEKLTSRLGRSQGDVLRSEGLPKARSVLTSEALQGRSVLRACEAGVLKRDG